MHGSGNFNLFMFGQIMPSFISKGVKNPTSFVKKFQVFPVQKFSLRLQYSMPTTVYKALTLPHLPMGKFMIGATALRVLGVACMEPVLESDHLPTQHLVDADQDPFRF